MDRGSWHICVGVSPAFSAEDFLLRQHDGIERFVTPQLAELAEWLVNALSAPFDGETKKVPHSIAVDQDVSGE